MRQIIPYIIFITLFIILFSYFTAGGLGKEAYSQETSIGSNPFPRPLAAISEDDEAVCSLNSVVCPSEKSLPSILYSEGRMAEISWYDELSSCHYPVKNGCLTASGKIAQYGMIATNLYPFGTKIKIEGLGIFTVEDRISKRYNNRIDVWVGYGQEANEQAKKNGIKKMKVEIL